MDLQFKVEILSQSENPQTTIWQASHQDYSDEFVAHSVTPSESECGRIAIKHLLNGGRGHFGPLEHPQIIFNCGYFPHSVMQQVRTHRNLSFDVQSFRYTGNSIYELGRGINSINYADIEKSFYLRPVGQYTDRQGKKYTYTSAHRNKHLHCIELATRQYSEDIDSGLSEEHARGLIPFDVRQHFVMSCNMRSLMHLLDLRAKPDAQLECQWLCDLIMDKFMEWSPEIAAWYKENRFKKGRLAP